MHACLDHIETTPGLLQGAVAIASHTDPDVDIAQIERAIAGIVTSVRSRLRSADRRAAVAHAHEVLFDELGFCGDTDDYYDPRNSYLHELLERRRGLPISLTLLYKLVLEPFGLVVRGVNAPGHFLARVEGGPDFTTMLVDPFAAGRVLSVPEAVAHVREVAGESFPFDADNLPLATHRDWLLRMLRNLIGVFHTRELPADRAAMEELARLVRGAD